MQKINRLYFYSVLWLSIFLCSCHAPASSTQKLAGADYKLWREVNEDEQRRNVITYYYFNREGKFQIYKKYRNSGEIKLLDMGDGVLIEEWKLTDNQLQIAGRWYDIILLTESNLVLRNTKLRDDTIHLIYKGDRLP